MPSRRIHFSAGQLNEYIYRLQRVARSLNFFSLMIIALTLLNIITPAVVWAYPRILYPGPLAVILISVGVFVAVFGLAVAFERKRKEGDALFQTLSDQLHGILSSRRKPEESPRYDLIPEARLSLQLFTQNSDLPLFPGRTGPALIVILNLGLLAFSLILQRSFSSF